MGLSSRDTAYRLSSVTPIDPKLVDIDRVFTNLLPLMKHEGKPVARRKRKLVTVGELVGRICEDERHFEGFADEASLVEGWLEADFLSLVHRGDPDRQNVAAPLPLHLNTYKLRNMTYCRDFGVADQLFAMFYYGAFEVMKELRDYLLEGMDYHTDQYDGETELDIESLVMMRLLSGEPNDYGDRRVEVKPPVPLCLGQARVLGDDIARLLAYREDVPRLVLVDYIKNVMALHVGLYVVRLFHIVEDLVERGEFREGCSGMTCGVGRGGECLFDGCEFPVDVIADVGEDHRSRMAELAREQFGHHVEVMNRYVRSHIKLKKLHEFGQSLQSRGVVDRAPVELEEILALREYPDTMELGMYFRSRVQSLMETGDGEPDERLVAIQRMGLNDVDTYVEMVFLLRQRYHQKYWTQLLESLLRKNSSQCLLRQGFGAINRRRYSLGSNLLETLVQIAVVEPKGGGGYRSRTMRIDELLGWLEKRYGIWIDRLPGSREAGIMENRALRENAAFFRVRLREIGFYTDLSDAYLSQTVRPRYVIGGSSEVGECHASE